MKPNAQLPLIGLEFQIVQTREATIAIVEVTIDDRKQVFSGTAKRFDNDFNAELGASLALGRALEKAGRKIQKRANGEIKCLDDNNTINVGKPMPKQFRAQLETQKLVPATH